MSRARIIAALDAEPGATDEQIADLLEVETWAVRHARAWLAGPGPRRGGPAGRAQPGRLVTLKLSLPARARLDTIPRLERGRWVSKLIEAAKA